MARASFYRQGRGHPQEDSLRERIRELAHAQVAFGYRRITAVLRRQGWRVNPKRVYRLYRQMELQKPVSKNGRRGLKRPVPFEPAEALAPGQVWAVDFVEDKLVSGRRLRILNVLDIFSRYAPGMSGTICRTRSDAIAGPAPCAVTVRLWWSFYPT